MLENLEKSQIIAKIVENLAIFTVILMTAFGTKNVHSAILGSSTFGSYFTQSAMVTLISQKRWHAEKKKKNIVHWCKNLNGARVCHLI